MKFLTGAVIGFGTVLISAVSAAAGAWPVIIAVGIVHHHWRIVPAFGFWAALVLLVALRMILPARAPAASS